MGGVIMKNEWNYMSGNLIVTVEALNHDDEKEQFEFECYCSPEINNYDKIDNIGDIAHHAAILRNLYRTEIVDIKEK